MSVQIELLDMVMPLMHMPFYPCVLCLTVCNVSMLFNMAPIKFKGFFFC